VFCCGPYEGSLRELVHLFKYGRLDALAKPLGKRLADALPAAREFDRVVPVPLHWRRRWRRGFNQSGLLAGEIARRRSIRLLHALRRGRPTPTQAGLSNSARRSNVAGAFALRRGARVSGLRLLLVDDVVTTGATAAACAAVLKRAGAASVVLLALARVDRRTGPPQILAAARGAA